MRRFLDEMTAAERQAIATGRAGGRPVVGAHGEPVRRSKGGFRSDIGCYVRSATEANVFRWLAWLKDRGQIKDFAYEPLTFRFEGVSRGPYTYTPDFLVEENDGRKRYVEVKGWMDPTSRNKLKRMARYFPLVEIEVIGEERYREISQLKPLIAGWE